MLEENIADSERILQEATQFSWTDLLWKGAETFLNAG
jgi:hypothetical protein